MTDLNYFSTTRADALASGMSAVETTVTLTDGSTFPDPALYGGTPYTVILAYGTSREEVCTVTAKPTATTLTVTRGQDGTPATTKNAGDVVQHGVSARDFLEIRGRVKKAGDTMTGALVLPGSPVSSLQAATKEYVDGRIVNTSSGSETDRAMSVLAAKAFSDSKVVDSTAGSETTVAPSVAATKAHVTAEIASSGLYQPYVPTVNQAGALNIAKTVHYAAYVRIGDLVICSVRLTAAAAGSAGSYVWVSLPVAPAHDGMVIGSGQITDTSVDKYPSVMLSLTTGPGVRFMRADASQPAASGTGVGNDPVMTLASGDTLSFTVMYEAA